MRPSRKTHLALCGCNEHEQTLRAGAAEDQSAFFSPDCSGTGSEVETEAETRVT